MESGTGDVMFGFDETSPGHWPGDPVALGTGGRKLSFGSAAGRAAEISGAGRVTDGLAEVPAAVINEGLFVRDMSGTIPALNSSSVCVLSVDADGHKSGTVSAVLSGPTRDISAVGGSVNGTESVGFNAPMIDTPTVTGDNRVEDFLREPRDGMVVEEEDVAAANVELTVFAAHKGEARGVQVTRQGADMALTSMSMTHGAASLKGLCSNSTLSKSFSVSLERSIRLTLSMLSRLTGWGGTRAWILGSGGGGRGGTTTSHAIFFSLCPSPVSLPRLPAAVSPFTFGVTIDPSDCFLP